MYNNNNTTAQLRNLLLILELLLIIIFFNTSVNGIWKCPTCQDWFKDSGVTTMSPATMRPPTTTVRTISTTNHHPTPTPPSSCGGEPGEPCQDNSDCCADCDKVKNICVCRGLGAPCENDGKCCSKICHAKDQRCSEFRHGCREALGKSDDCVHNEDCCSNKCENKLCSCKFDGESCKSNIECCFKVCDGGVCKRQCKALGESCRIVPNPECCGGACIKHKCADCLSLGSVCDEDANDSVCCSTGCGANNTCEKSRAAVPSFPGGPCNIDIDCDGGGTKCEANILCGLGSTIGDPCKSDFDCFPNGNEKCNMQTGLCDKK